MKLMLMNLLQICCEFEYCQCNIMMITFFSLESNNIVQNTIVIQTTSSITRVKSYYACSFTHLFSSEKL